MTLKTKKSQLQQKKSHAIGIYRLQSPLKTRKSQLQRHLQLKQIQKMEEKNTKNNKTK
jgi:hypothetical protein